MQPHEAVIRAYPTRASLRAGAQLGLHVSSDAAYFNVEIWRVGKNVERIHIPSHAYDGIAAPPGAANAPWNWPLYGIPLPSDVRAGVYVARCIEGNASFHDKEVVDAREGAALFIVRAPQRSEILFHVPLFTYHAYNTAERDPARGDTEGACLYTGAAAVTLARPGGGIGGRFWDEANLDAYDLASPRQSFEHWDRKALDWLEQLGVDLDFSTDLDLHDDPDLLEGRRLLLCFGHHEYWTDAMRDRVEGFVARGGNVGFFGANSLWFRVGYDAATQSIRRLGAWDVPENALTGVSYRCGGGKWIGPRPPSGFTVQDAAHWIFANTGLADGDTFGAQCRLVGYECDGLAARGDASTPKGLLELARCELNRWNVTDGSGEVFPNGHASLTIYERGGTVINAGSVDWPRALALDATVARITSNAVTRLRGRPPE